MSEMALIVHHADKDDVIWEADDGTFNVTRIMAIARTNPDKCGPFLVDLEPGFAGYVMRSCGVDVDRALAMPLKAAQKEPLLAIEDPKDGTTRMIDGHHRLVRMDAAGVQRFWVWIVPAGLLPPMVTYSSVPVSNLPAELAAKGLRPGDLR